MWFKKKDQAVVKNITEINKTYPEIKFKISIKVGGLDVEVSGNDRHDTLILFNEFKNAMQWENNVECL